MQTTTYQHQACKSTANESTGPNTYYLRDAVVHRADEHRSDGLKADVPVAHAQHMQ